jgi:hypothetical protein
MTTPRCKACSHPSAPQINAEILRGVSDRVLASLFPGVARCGFQRHRKHISAELKRSRETHHDADKSAGGSLDGSSGSLPGQPGSVGSPAVSLVPPAHTDPINVVEQLNKFLPVLRGLVGRSIESRQWFAAAAASREYREFLKLVAQLDGTLALTRARPADEPIRLKDLTDEQLAAIAAEALGEEE